MTAPKLRTATEFVNERIKQHQKLNNGNIPNVMILPPWIVANLMIEHEEHFDYPCTDNSQLIYWGIKIKPTGTPGELDDCLALARMFAKVRHLVEGDQTVRVE